MPEASAVFHRFLKFINTGIREKDFSEEELNSIKDMLETLNQVLWIIDFEILDSGLEIPEDIQEKFELRNNAKKEKNFDLADKLRDELLEKWYKIVDNRDGSFLEKL